MNDFAIKLYLVRFFPRFYGLSIHAYRECYYLKLTVIIEWILNVCPTALLY